MYVGFGSFNGKAKLDNKGSSGAAISYLSKENNEKKLRDQEHFFNHDNDRIREAEAQQHIDGFNKHIGKNEAKFYMFTINPSEREQQHLIKLSLEEQRPVKIISELTRGEKAKYQELLKNYTKNVMELYASNFNKGVQGKDVVYVAKVEHERIYKSFHEEVKHNSKLQNKIYDLAAKMYGEKEGSRGYIKYQTKIKEVKAAIKTTDDKPLNADKSNLIKRGEKKEGMQSHVHVVVHRNTKDYVKISPNAKSRGHQQKGGKGQKVAIGFDHEQFKEASGKLFQEQFNYKPKENEMYKKPVRERVVSKLARKTKNKLSNTAKSEVYSKVFHSEVLQMKSQAQQLNSLVKTLANIHKPHKIFANILNKTTSNIKTAARAK